MSDYPNILSMLFIFTVLSGALGWIPGQVARYRRMRRQGR